VVSITYRPRFTPGETIPGTHCTAGWVGSRAGLDTEARGKIISPLLGIEPRSSACPARQHTDWATRLSSVGQLLWKIPVLLWDQNVHYVVHKSQPLDIIRIELNPVHNLCLRIRFSRLSASRLHPGHPSDFFLLVQCLTTDWITGVWSRAEATDFSSSICVQTSSETHPASYPMGPGGPFPEGKAQLEREAGHSPPCSANGLYLL
jgi:hypothetical protein